MGSLPTCRLRVRTPERPFRPRPLIPKDLLGPHLPGAAYVRPTQCLSFCGRSPSRPLTTSDYSIFSPCLYARLLGLTNDSKRTTSEFQSNTITSGKSNPEIASCQLGETGSVSPRTITISHQRLFKKPLQLGKTDITC